MPVPIANADIRPVSDLRNHFAEVADYVQAGNAVIFTKNGRGCMVTISFDSWKALADPILADLRRADEICESDNRHFTRDEALSILKERADARRGKLHA